MDDLEAEKPNTPQPSTRRMSSVTSHSSTEEDDSVHKSESEEITKRKKGFAQRFQELKTRPKKKDDKNKEETMESISDGEGELKSKRRLGVIEKIRRFGSRENLDDDSKAEKENKKPSKERGRKSSEDVREKRKRSKSREGALAFFDRFRGIPDDGSSSSDEEEFSQEFLKVANRCRKNHGLESFVVNKELSTLAHDYARTLAKEQNIKERRAQKYGRNIYKKELKSNEVKVNADDIIYSWYQEINNFKFGQNPLDPDITKNATQLLWKDSREVGVGKVKSGSKNIVFVAAYFSPRGNIIGQYANNVPPIGGFSPDLSKSEKQKDSFPNDEDDKPNNQEIVPVKGKENERGKMKFLTHMFDKLRKTSESEPEAPKKKDKNENYGYIGTRQGKYFVNTEKSSVDSHPVNKYVATTEELEEARSKLRNQTCESKSSEECNSIVNQSKPVENVERLQTSEVKEDSSSSNSSDKGGSQFGTKYVATTEELEKARLKLKSQTCESKNSIESNSIINHSKQFAERLQTSEAKEDTSSNSSSEGERHEPLNRKGTFSKNEILDLDQSSNYQEQQKEAENEVVKSDNYLNHVSTVNLHSEEQKPHINFQPQNETLVYISQIELNAKNPNIVDNDNDHEAENLSNATHTTNEKNTTKIKVSTSESNSDSDDSDSKNKVVTDTTKKTGIFSHVKEKLIRLAQSSSEESSDNEDKIQNQSVNDNNDKETLLLGVKPIYSIKHKNTEIEMPSPIIQQNDPLPNVSFQFSDKKDDDKISYSSFSESESDAHVTVVTETNTIKESLSENSEHNLNIPHNDSSSSDEGTNISKLIKHENSDDGLIIPIDDIKIKDNFNKHQLEEYECKFDEFEVLPETENSTANITKKNKLNHNTSSSDEDNSVQENFSSRIEVEGKESGNTNLFEKDKKYDFNPPDLTSNKNDKLKSMEEGIQKGSHDNSSCEGHPIDKTETNSHYSETEEHFEMDKLDPREKLNNLPLGENEEQNTTNSNGDMHKLFFEEVMDIVKMQGNSNLHDEKISNEILPGKEEKGELKSAERAFHQEEAKQRDLKEEKSSSSDSDSDDEDSNKLYQKKYPKSPKTVHKISVGKSSEEISYTECSRESSIEENNVVAALAEQQVSKLNENEPNHLEENAMLSDESEAKLSCENIPSQNETDTPMKSKKPPARRRSFKNLLQGIARKKRNENSETDVNQKQTFDSSDATSGNESSSSNSEKQIKSNGTSHLEAHVNSSDSDSHDDKRKPKMKSLKTMLLDLSLTKKHDQIDSNSHEKIETSNTNSTENLSPSGKVSASINSISSKNSETESSDIDCGNQKQGAPLRKRRKSLKDLFQDIKLSISPNNTDTEKSGPSSPVSSSVSPNCDKDERKDPKKQKSESYISKIKQMFESTENIFHKIDDSDKHLVKKSFIEDCNGQECLTFVLQNINKIREKHNAEHLKLDKQLCDVAKERAESLASGIAGNLHNDLGENIFIHGISEKELKDILELAVVNWYKTISFHRFGIEPEEYNMKAGSFTQLVWRSSKDLGVGIHVCQEEVPNRIIIVALFSPGGNRKGRFTDEVHPRIQSSESESEIESPNLSLKEKNLVCNESKQI